METAMNKPNPDLDIARIRERAETLSFIDHLPDAPWVLPSGTLKLLAAFIREEQPQNIVELGSGRSTLLISQELQTHVTGRLLSIEHNSTFSNKTLESLSEHKVQHRATVVHCPLRPTLRRNRLFVSYSGIEHYLSSFRPIDLFIIDGPPGPWGREAAMYSAFTYIRTGGAIFLDDAFRNKEKQAVEQWVAYYGANLRVEQTFSFGNGLAILTKGDISEEASRGNSSRRRDDWKISAQTVRSLIGRPMKTKRDIVG